MLHEKSTRAKIGIFAIAVGLIGTIIALFAPTFMTETLHFSKGNIVLLSAQDNLFISLGSLIVIVIILILLAIKHTKVTYSLATIAILAVIGFCTWTLTNYTAIQNEQIITKSYTNENVLKWTDIEQVIYEYHTDLPYGQYIFQTADDEIMITETLKFGPDEKRKIYSTARSFDVTFIEREMTTE